MIEQHFAHLGFEIGTGEPISVPRLHTIITGQTQRSGKTTLLEALIRRANVPAVTFITKRGEASFSDARRIPPYFRDQGDWEFVASILEASRAEKLKYERSAIIEVSKGADSLTQVHENVRAELSKKRTWDRKAYTCLDAYLNKVVPHLHQVQWANSVQLLPGVNAMDLTLLSVEMQHLVIKSTLDWVLNKEENTIVVVPEAWKFAPQKRGTPVKLAAEEYVRQAAGLGNFLWMDSQDIAGVDKLILKSFPLWILGVQREINEIERTLDQIPTHVKKPKPDAIAKLKLGQFYVCWDEHVYHVYAQPIWMSDDDARRIARGEADVMDFAAPKHDRAAVPTAVVIPDPPRGREQISMAAPPAPPEPLIESEDEMSAQDVTEIKEHFTKSIRDLGDQIVKGLRGAIAPPAKEMSTANASTPAPASPASMPADEESQYQRFRSRLLNDEGLLVKVAALQPEIEIAVERKVIETDGSGAEGMIAILIKEQFFKEVTTANAAWKEMKRRWDYSSNNARAYEQCDKFTRWGFLTKEEGGYKQVAGRLKDIKEKQK